VSKSQSFTGIPESYRRNVVLKTILVFIGGIILTTVVLYMAVRQPIGPTYGEGFRMLAQLQQDIFYKAAIIYAITVFVIVCSIIFLTLIYSHRVAGPVYRLTVFARTLCSGDFSSKAHIRQKDVIHPLADEMNNMVFEYRQSFNTIQEEISTLEQYAERLDEKQDNEEVWMGIEEKAGKITAELERYKI